MRALAWLTGLAALALCGCGAQVQQDVEELRAQVESLEKRVVLLENDAAQARTPTVVATPVSTVTGGVERSPEAEKYGLLRLAANPWADVYVDGKKVGTTPLAGYKLEAGNHQIKLLNPNCSPVSRVIKIEAGKTNSEVISLKCP